MRYHGLEHPSDRKVLDEAERSAVLDSFEGTPTRRNRNDDPRTRMLLLFLLSC